jgi:excisionase family DNA binding protein
MPDRPPSGSRLLAPAQVAELLDVSVEEVVALVHEGRLRGMRVGSPARWRVEEDSVDAYLEDQAEEARRMALWRQSNAASFPELWGRGRVPKGD